jgi:hypothetical protein
MLNSHWKHISKFIDIRNLVTWEPRTGDERSL